MASFDFVECTTRAFSFVWKERSEVVRLSAMVIAIKVVSFIALILFELQDNLLRQGILLIPSYYLEGVVIARLVIVATQTHERMNADNLQASLQASAIIYLLIKMALSFVTGMTAFTQGTMPDTTSSEPTMSLFVVAFFILLLMIWSFRFLWLYVPIALGYSLIDFMRKFKSFSSSLYMIGLWIMCMVPVGFFMVICIELLAMIFPPIGDEKSMVLKLGIAFVQAIADYGLALVSSIGMAYGIHSVFNNENKTTSLF